MHLPSAFCPHLAPLLLVSLNITVCKPASLPSLSPLPFCLVEFNHCLHAFPCTSCPFAWPSLPIACTFCPFTHPRFRYLQVFIAISIFLGDGLYNLVKMVILTGRNFWAQRKARDNLPTNSKGLGPKGELMYPGNLTFLLAKQLVVMVRVYLLV